MRSDTTYLKIILLLCLLGILVSGKLLSMHVRYTSGSAGLTETCTLISASSSQGCESVAVSNYSDIAGIPIAAIAMGFYFTQLLLVFWAMRNYQTAYESLYVGFFLSTLSILMTVRMFTIANYVLHEFCQWCAMLWLINLAIWPAFVKQLGLRWGNALAGNLELFRHKNLNLKRSRIIGSLGVGIVCVVAFSVIGMAAKGLQNPDAGMQAASLVKDYGNAPAVFLPAEAYGGPSAKGQVDASPAPTMDIVEFADFQCPACRMAAQFLKPFVLKHHDKVRVTFRNFPLDGSCNTYVPNGQHTFACAAARNGVCAGKQGKFWSYHDQVYDRQDELSTALINEVVSKIGLDQGAFAACLADPATEAEIQKDTQWGDMIGLESTPTIVINGHKLSGAKSPAELEALLVNLESQRTGK
ncbi:MAG: thioredoxin domain-containing protein [Bdellovibrionota bacterium]